MPKIWIRHTGVVKVDANGNRMVDCKDIEGKANEFTKVYSEPPISVYRIAWNLGVQVWVTDFDEIAEEHSGFL